MPKSLRFSDKFVFDAEKDFDVKYEPVNGGDATYKTYDDGTLVEVQEEEDGFPPAEIEVMRGYRELCAERHALTAKLWYVRIGAKNTEAGKKIEKLYGKKAMRELESDPFAVAELEGRLAAIRWVLGGEYRDLDT